MRELLYAIPGGRPGQGLEWGLTPAHMSYRVGPGPRLVGVGLTPEVRGGAMMVSCAGDPGGGDCRLCCRQVAEECRRRGFDRVVCDFEGAPVGTLEQLARTLSAQCSQAGLALYLPESYASLAPDCRVLVSSVVTSGTLSRRLEYAMERWGADRVVLAVEAAAEDFPLPADGRGSPLGPERLQELMDRLEPAVFFDRGLCAHYFTYIPPLRPLQAGSGPEIGTVRGAAGRAGGRRLAGRNLQRRPVRPQPAVPKSPRRQPSLLQRLSRQNTLTQKTAFRPKRNAVFLLVILFAVLAGGLALLAALDAGAVIIFALANLGQHAGLGAAALEALQGVLQRLALADMNFRHLYFPPSEASGSIQDALRAIVMALTVVLYENFPPLSTAKYGIFKDRRPNGAAPASGMPDFA